MKRRLFTLCSALSLLLCAAVCVLWVRSYGHWAGAIPFGEPPRYLLMSAPGRVVFRQLSPGGVEGDLVAARGWAFFGFAAYSPQVGASALVSLLTESVSCRWRNLGPWSEYTRDDGSEGRSARLAGTGLGAWARAEPPAFPARLR